MLTNIIHVDNLTNDLVITHRDNLRGHVEKTESLIPDLLARGRAPTASFPAMQFLGYVELDRGEEDLRSLVSQLLAPLIDVVTDEEFQVGFMTYGEPISVEELHYRLDWCVTSDPVAAKRFPEWSQLDELHRLEAVCQFVGETLLDYRLRLLEVADTEEVTTNACQRPIPPTRCRMALWLTGAGAGHPRSVIATGSSMSPSARRWRDSSWRSRKPRRAPTS